MYGLKKMSTFGEKNNSVLMENLKSRVELSRAASLTTIFVFAILLGVAVLNWNLAPGAGVVSYALIVISLAVSLCHAPMSVSLDDKCVRVNSSLKIRLIPFAEIASVERFKPSTCAVRVFASGGFMGYWGVFSEKSTGRYTAYYGNESDCFMVTLRSGRKYVLGCKGADRMVAEIAARLS